VRIVKFMRQLRFKEFLASDLCLYTAALLHLAAACYSLSVTRPARIESCCPHNKLRFDVRSCPGRCVLSPLCDSPCIESNQ